MKKAVIYLRVSSDGQDYERQRADLLSLAQRWDYKVTAIYEEKKSAVESMTTRDELMKLRKLTKSEVDVILFWDITRLSRRASDFIQLVTEFSDKGISLHFKDKNIITLDEDGRLNLMAQMYLYILGVFAQMDAEAIQSKMQSGKENSLRKGNSYTYTAPTGYLMIDKKLVIDFDIAPFIIKAFEMYAGDATLQDIADYFNAHNVPMKFGKGKMWIKGTIRNILHNTCYIGQGKRKSKEFGIRTFSCPPLISNELFTRVQNKFQTNKVVIDKSRSRDNLLRGLLYCGECGKNYYLSANNGNTVYKCADKIANVNTKIGCVTGGSTKVDAIDEMVWDAIKEIYYSEEYIKQSLINKENSRKLIEDKHKGLNGYIQLINELNKELDKLQTGYIKGFIGEDYMTQHLPEIKSKIKKYEAQINQLNIEIANLNNKLGKVSVEDIESRQLTTAEKKLICKELIDCVKIFKRDKYKVVLDVTMNNGLQFYILGIVNKTFRFVIIKDSSVVFNAPSQLYNVAGATYNEFTVESDNNTIGIGIGDYTFDEFFDKMKKSHS